MYLNIIGSILIIGATSAVGYTYGVELKKHVEALRQLKRIMMMLCGEIKYTKVPFQEAFGHISRRQMGDYQKWLAELSHMLEERVSLSFTELWERAIENNLQDTALKKEDINQLKILGANMGYLDEEMQLNTLQLYLDQLDGEIQTAQGSLAEKRRLCNCLGVMGGILIVIVLF